ncbi:uncharacterized protein reeld1 isoform 2-T2 [Spinachia spinachia]
MWSHLGSPLRWLGVGVVLLSLAPSTLTFSSGAGHASCGEMIPGHIRSQPREAGREHVALRASVSSYLPGQLVTVTVRSSRDFMGFLLQARRVGSAKKWVGSRLGGPVLVGGSWTFAPPGTHSLRCLSQGDTLTHSDKQLKRNLSFVWRAPDAPAGDIRFYITVVQSYFLYWAGIESAVVRDGSRGRQTGSNVTGVDEGNYAQQEEEVTPLPASNKETNHRARLGTTLGPSTPTSRGAQSLRPQKTKVLRPVWQVNPVTNQAVNKRKKSSFIWPFNQHATKGNGNDTHKTLGSVTGVSEETGSTNNVFKAGETDILSNITGPLFLLQPHASPLPLMKGGIQRNSEGLIPPNVPETTVNSRSTNMPSTFHNTNPPKTTSQNRRETISHQTISVRFVTQSTWLHPRKITKSQTSLIKDEKGHNSVPQSQDLQLKPSLQTETASAKPLLHSPTSLSQTFRKPLSMSRTSLPLISPSNTPILQSVFKTRTTSPLSQANSSLLQVLPIKPTSSLFYPEKSRPTTKSRQTAALPLSSPSPLQPVSVTLVLNQTIPTQTHSQTSYTPTHHSKSAPPAEALSTSAQPSFLQWFWPPSQTAYPQVHTLGTSSAVQSIDLLDSRFRQSEAKEVKGPLSQAKLESSSFLLVSNPFSSSHGLHDSSLVPPTTPLYLSEGSAPSSVHPSSTSTKNLPKTARALTSHLFPSPISIPPHSPPQPSSTSPLPFSLISSTRRLSSSSNYPFLSPLIASTSLSTSSPSLFASSQTIMDSAISSPSFATISPALSSSSSTSSISSLPSPSSYYPSIATFTSTSSFSNLSATFSSSLSRSTTPHPKPSPAPRRSLYNTLASSTSFHVPPQKLPPAQRMPIQNHVESSDAETISDLPTPRTAVHPNLNPNLGPELKPNLPKTNPESIPPSNPPGTPDKEGKHPGILPRHSAWELSMLLGCSAGLGTVLVVLVRYTCRQSCGKQTQLTLNDREMENRRGERGLLHLQEGGDLVRVRRIRENSFVLLAEYNVLASPGD